VTGILRRVEALDRRWVFLVMLVAISFPLFVEIDLPIRVSPESRGFFKAIDRLEPGEVVYLAADYDPSARPELDPQMKAVLDQLFSKNIKIVSATLWPAGPPLLEEAINARAKEWGKTYGTDYVNLGFKEGKENVMVQLGKSFREVYPNDYYGTPLDSLALLRNGGPGGRRIDNFSDVKLLINISGGYPGTKEWVQQVRSRFEIPMISGCTAVSAPEYYPYVQSGQLSGLLGGLAGAAEYEELTGRPGWGVTGMSAQSLGHVTIIVLILVGNAVYFWNRRPRRGQP
jgi:hypothetical protein